MKCYFIKRMKHEVKFKGFNLDKRLGRVEQNEISYSFYLTKKDAERSMFILIKNLADVLALKMKYDDEKLHELISLSNPENKVQPFLFDKKLFKKRFGDYTDNSIGIGPTMERFICFSHSANDSFWIEEKKDVL